MPVPARIPPLSRRGLLRAAALTGGAVASGAAGGGLGLTLGAQPAFAATLGPGDPVLANDVRQEFLTAWTAYRRVAFGRDELNPLSGIGSDFFISGASLGLTLVEALDTLFLMELDGELGAGLREHLVPFRDDMV